MSQGKSLKASFFTLGCKANQYDTEQIKKRYLEQGFEIVGFRKSADLCVVNTCAVTHIAERKSRAALYDAVRTNPQKEVIAVGCAVKASPEKFNKIGFIKATDFDLRFTPCLPAGRNDYSRFTIHDPRSTTNRIRAFLKIQDGCEEYCSYCIVPYVRGKIRSHLPEEVLKEAEELVENGVREIVLTGINLATYGFDFVEKKTVDNSCVIPAPYQVRDDTINVIKVRNQYSVNYHLITLLELLSQIENLKRIRLSSLEPMYVSEELIKAIADLPKVCNHLHFPLQSADDKILKLMRRRYTADDFFSLVKFARKLMPDVGINTDILVGFPDEGEKEFENTLKFVEKINFSRSHVFRFSRRPFTIAKDMPNQVDFETVFKRSRILHDLRSRQMQEFSKKYLGKVFEVLVEQKNKFGLLEGLTDNYIRVIFEGAESLVGHILQVQLEIVNGEEIFGKIYENK